MAKKRKPKKEQKRQRQLKRKVLRFFRNASRVPYNYKQVAAGISVEKNAEKKLVALLMEELATEGFLEQVGPGKFRSLVASICVQGKVDMTKSGSAYVVSSETEEDIFIRPKNLSNALNGDTVSVQLLARRKNRKPEGEVVEIVKRAKTAFAGRVEVSQKFAFLVPDDKKVHVDIYIPLEHLNGVKTGDKALAEITDWPKDASSPFGRVIEVLGKPGEPNTEMLSVLANSGTPQSFPKNVLEDAKKISQKITKEDTKGREDFRAKTTFTIDPEDAKDFDDALSVEEVKEGVYEIGVHIADVTHYLKEGSAIDKEAVERATSIYLVDRVVPMLPETLSNNLCSLRPNEDKLCYSVVFKINKQAKVLESRVVKTIINSDKRFTYDQAQNIIEGLEGDFKEEVLLLNGLAKKLRKKRTQAGSIAFESKEVKFRLNKESLPVSVYFKEQKEANKLIEEFMLLANQSVAKKIAVPKGGKPPKTFVYRIHDKPDPEKINAFKKFVKKFGYQLNNKNHKVLSNSLNSLLESAKGKNEQAMVESLAIRSMAKAEYSTENIGHYGLAFDYYSHFTSPIRRYPDVLVHRLLYKYLQGGQSAKKSSIEELCKHCSERERKAIEAERESTKYYQVKFMEDKVGEVFEGVISGVTEWGLYVEITENGCEGLIRVKDLDDDYYMLDEENYQLIGQRTKNTYRLGEKIEVIVTRASVASREIDLELA